MRRTTPFGLGLIGAVWAGCQGTGGSGQHGDSTAHDALIAMDGSEPSDADSSASEVAAADRWQPWAGEMPTKLSTLGLFELPMAAQSPAPGVYPYEVVSPLWSDHAEKSRFMALPPETHAEPTFEATWEFPVGTMLVKTFWFPEDLRAPDESPANLVETRLLVHELEGWAPYVYRWDADGQDATLHNVGSIISLGYVDQDGQPQKPLYVIPNTNQCLDCHSNSQTLAPIGPSSRQLSRDVVRHGETKPQLDWFVESGVLPPSPNITFEAPLADPFDAHSTFDLQTRAHSYLEANCAHCHRPGGEGGPSGLVLLASEINPHARGICKKPVAAGSATANLKYVIVPGAPDQSILIHRMASTDPAVRMPEIPNLLVHKEGLDLIRAYIESLPPKDCDAPN